MDEREAMSPYAGPGRSDAELEALKKELENLNVQEELARLENEFNEALKLPPKQTSGLVEMQKWFAKLRQQTDAKKND